jgi:hypothetical protein
MAILDDLALIPRKHKNGTGNNKTVTSVYITHDKLNATRAIAKVHNVSISGVMELALDRLFADIDRETPRLL